MLWIFSEPLINIADAARIEGIVKSEQGINRDDDDDDDDDDDVKDMSCWSILFLRPFFLSSSSSLSSLPFLQYDLGFLLLDILTSEGEGGGRVNELPILKVMFFF
jgi:hypothetical protein